ncbi:MAG: hypothetical protein IKF14_14445 [Atopobiaceae bacterium]|nr:hypothetical protein [Atopobiaceae bacterium]
MRRVVIIGAGNVGSQCAASIMMLGLADEIVLLDVNSKLARAQVMDLDDMASGLKQRVAIRVGTYEDCTNAEFIVLSAGKSRMPGQSRRDMLQDTMRILDPIAESIKQSGFGGILICVTNPVDVVAEHLYRVLDLSRAKVFGTGTALDTARLRRIISKHTGVSRQHIQAFALGEHGESSFLWGSHLGFEGVTLPELMYQREALPPLKMGEINKLVRQRGGDIIAGKGRTEFGISTVVTDIMSAVIHNEHSIMALSVHLRGEYDESDISVSVPCIVGACGIEEVLQVNMTEQEISMLHMSCEAIRGYAKNVLG